MDALGWAGAPPAVPQRYWSQPEARQVWALNPLLQRSLGLAGVRIHLHPAHGAPTPCPSPMATCASSHKPASPVSLLHHRPCRHAPLRTSPRTTWGLWGAFLTPIRQGWSHPAWHLRQAPSGCSHAVFRLCCLPGSGSTSASPMGSNRRTEAELPVRHCSLRCTLKYPQFKSGKQGTEMF